MLHQASGRFHSMKTQCCWPRSSHQRENHYPLEYHQLPNISKRGSHSWLMALMESCAMLTMLSLQEGTEQNMMTKSYRVLLKFRVAGLTLNEKCQFSLTEVHFLGKCYKCSTFQSRPRQNKSDPGHARVKGRGRCSPLHGMVNFVGTFSPHLPDMTKPTCDLLKTESSCSLGAPQVKAFLETQKELGSETVLAQYSPDHETEVSADASPYGIGGVLTEKQQKQVETHCLHPR